MRHRTENARRRASACVAAVVLLFACASCAGSSSAAARECSRLRTAWAPVTDKGKARAAGALITINAANAAFAPTCITDVPEGPVTLVVHNTGQSIHNVRITAQHIDVDITPGHTANIRVVVGHDPVVYVCKYHRYLGMVGFLIPAGT